MKVAVTICARVKDERPELMPARRRYLGEHIGQVEKIAAEAELPFFILSGKYGLISADEQIPNYDYYLETGAVNALAEMIAEQLRKNGITEIDFYTEGKANWAPYAEALEKGAELSGVALKTHVL